ncbi:MAG: aminotransferase class V-fold PLP-dependent enzyme [Acidobacteriaceae bacterium]|nr:aminotransferase class V-fold PLP-dependent enzyme [Acidobacteriaceae bacterium]
MKTSRRRLLQSSALLPAAAASAAVPAQDRTASTPSSLYASLGIKPVINGVGVVTVLGGSLMPPEVVQAMEEAARYFIPLPELQKKVGARLAELLQAPACMVTCGAASAISVGTAACLSQGDPAKLRQLPGRDGIRYEVIQQRSHRSGYEHQMELCGAKIVTVETRQELENAINERTGMLFFLNKAEPLGQVSAEDFVKIGKARGIPTMNDAASDATPKENLWKYTKMGFDLVIFSGGKALRGPQASGLLLGRKDLIEAAQPAMSPYGGIGRGMKVGKEEMVGLLAAVERYLKVDHAAEWKLLESRVASIRQALAGAKGVTTERHIPVIANELPHVTVHWDEAARGLTAQQVGDRLLASDPPIQVQRPAKGQLLISVWMMRGNEHEIVGRRLKEIFR